MERAIPDSTVVINKAHYKNTLSESPRNVREVNRTVKTEESKVVE